MLLTVQMRSFAHRVCVCVTLILKAEARDYGKGVLTISDAACGVWPITMHCASWPIRADCACPKEGLCRNEAGHRGPTIMYTKASYDPFSLGSVRFFYVLKFMLSKAAGIWAKNTVKIVILWNTFTISNNWFAFEYILKYNYSCDAKLNFQHHNSSLQCHMILQKSF